jgi:uncharacterized delta-60 repeat protein/fimbrial isopeptide formation D2 family protein
MLTTFRSRCLFIIAVLIGTIGSVGVYAADGTIDRSFNVGGLGPNSDVLAVAMQSDGKIVIGGFFSSYNGDFAASDYVMRLNADGTRDTTFNPGGAGANKAVYAVAIQPDGKILIAGQFTSYNGDAAASDYVLRLNADGTRDTTFNAGGSGANDYVWGFALQPDGQILVAGNFFTYNGNPTSGRVMRLNTDGTLDTTFNEHGSGANGSVSAVAVQPDGKIVIAGLFTSYNGDAAASDYVMRLNADGTRDATFNPVGTGADHWVHAVAIQSDGKIFIGGDFTAYNGDAAASDYVMRLNADGTRDATFNVGGTGADAAVNVIAVQPDGKIVMAGVFTGYNGDVGASHYVIRLNTDGKPDTTFNPGGAGANALVYGLAVQPDGGMVVGGEFTAYNGDFAVPAYVIRLLSTPTTPVCAGVPGDIISWWPGGGNAQDIVGHYDGALQNGATFGTGMVGQAFSLDGIDDAIVVGNFAALNPASITVEAWIKPNGVPAGTLADVVTKWGFDATIDSYFLGLLNSGGVVKVLGGIGDGATGDPGFSGGTVTLNAWNHIAMTYDAASGLNRLYLNGASVSQRVRAHGIYPTTSRVFIGREDSNNKRFFSGLIDEPTIYSRALTDAEILAIYNAGGNGKCGATPPTAVDDGPYPISEDSPLTVDAPGVLANDTDLEGDHLTAIKVSDPAHGSVTVNADGSFTYTPAADYNGTDSFTYKANDGTADSNAAIVIITIQPRPDAPMANAGPDQTSATGFVQLDGTASFDPDGDAIQFEWSEGATTLGGGPTLPINLGEGQHTITLTVTDSTGKTGTDTVLVTVTISQVRSVTALSLVASPNPATVGRDVTLTASVSSPGGIPVGEVLFTFRNGLPLGSPVPLNASGVATLLIPGSALAGVGSVSLGAQYGGNDAYLPSQDSTTLNIVQAATQTRLTSSINPSLTTGPPVFFADIVTDSAIQPSGKVEFFADGALLCRSTVFSRERRRLASCGGAPLAVGDHPVTAIYTGDQNFLASEVASLTQTVRLGTYNTLDLGFDGEAIAISPNGYIAGNSLITLSGATAYFYDGTPHAIPSLGGGSQAVSADDVGRVFGTSATSTGALHAFEFLQGVTTDRGTLGGVSSLTKASNVNGAFVGASQNGAGETHGFVDFGGGLTDLGTLGGAVSAAKAISDNGTVVGVAARADGTPHAVLFGNQAPSLDLGTVGGTSSVAEAVNNAAEVAGTSDTENPSFVHAFIWRPDGGLQDLGTLLGSGSTQAVDINDAGQVVGIDNTTVFTDPKVGVRRRHPFLYSNGSLLDLGAVSTTSGFVSSISNAGMVIGGSDPLGFASNGVTMADLPTLGGVGSAARAINDAGQIVGWSDNAAGSHRATLWTPVAAASLVVDAASGQENGVVSLRATLTSFGEAVTGKTITFSLNGRDVATAVTDSNGVAQVGNVSLFGIPVGSYPTGGGARFSGDMTLAPAAGDAALTVGPAPDLTISKSIVTAQGNVSAVTVSNGDFVTFQLRVSNGAGATYGPTTGSIEVDDALDPRLSFVAAGSDSRCFEMTGRGFYCSSPGPLAPGASDAFTVVTRVARDAASVGQSIVITNVAEVGTANESLVSNNTSGAVSISVIGPRPPDLVITKTILTPQGPAAFVQARTSELVTFQLRVSADLVHGSTTGLVTATDALDPRLSFVAEGSDSRCAAAGQIVMCVSPGPLAPGGSDTFTVVTRLAADAVLGSQTINIFNRAGVSTPTEVDVANNVSNAVTVFVSGHLPSDLSIVKTIVTPQGPATTVTVGNSDVVTFQLVITNASDTNHGPTTGPVDVVDVLDKKLLFNPVGSDGRCSSTFVGTIETVRCAPTRLLLAGESVRFIVTTHVRSGAVGYDGTATLENTAVVSTPNDENAANNQATPVTIVVKGPRRPDLSVAKTIETAQGPATAVTVNNGDSVTFQLRVSNNGQGPAAWGSVDDVLNQALFFVSDDAGHCRAYIQQTVHCSLPGPLPPGQSFTFRFVTGVRYNAAGYGQTIHFTNNARVSTQEDLRSYNNQSNSVDINVVGPKRPDLSIVKTIETPQGPATDVNVINGEFVTFDLRVTNAAGRGDATQRIDVLDRLAKGLEFVSATASTGTCWMFTVADGNSRDTHQDVLCSPLSRLAAGQSVAFRIVTRVNVGAAGGQPIRLTNTAKVTTQNDANTSNNQSGAVTVTVTDGKPDLSIGKTIVTPQGLTTTVTVGNGDLVTFQLLVANAPSPNHGPTTAPVEVVDVLDGRLSFVAGSSDRRCAATLVGTTQTVRCDPGRLLLPGESVRFIVTTQVGADVAGAGQTIHLTNTAVVSTADDDNAANNTSGAVDINVRGPRLRP